MAQTPPEKQPDRRKPQDDAPPPRHNRPFPVGMDAKSAGAFAFVRAGFSDPTLVLRWNEIAGAAIARLAQPLKFSQGPSGGTLTLRAAPGAALFLSHEKRSLCERINAYLGHQAVVQVKFVQGAPLPARPAPQAQKKQGALPPGDPSGRYQGPDGLAKALQALARRR
jgi:hypothetical protein